MALNPNTQFLVIKMQEGNLNEFRNYLQTGNSRPDKNDDKYYVNSRNASDEDLAVFKQLAHGVEYRCAFVDFISKKEDEEIKEQKAKTLYWTSVKVTENGLDLVCSQRKFCSSDEAVLNYFRWSLINLDLIKDFGGTSSRRYMYLDENPKLMSVLDRCNLPCYEKPVDKVGLKTPMEIRTAACTYNEDINPLAQRDEYCIRRYKAASVVAASGTSGSGNNPQEDANQKAAGSTAAAPQYFYEKDEFAKDYDAIVGSKAFRRMVDKAQVFSAAKGDHYRTRMTHTQVVCYIARRICDRLKLNSRLAEAIAMGHDLGHTPFGHQGERTLQNVLEGAFGVLPMKNDSTLEERVADAMEQALPHTHTIVAGNCLANTVSRDDILTKLATKPPVPRFVYGGFKHNYQSVRVATTLETLYPEFDGLNLSAQTLNGMWMHTKTKESDYHIAEFANGFEEIYKKPATEVEEAAQTATEDGGEKSADSKQKVAMYECPFTLEGQVVAVADEIAQRSHDIDDAFASKLVTVDDLCEDILPQKAEGLKSNVAQLRKNIQDLKARNRLFTDEEETLCAGISKIIVDYFIDRVCESTVKNMAEYRQKNFTDPTDDQKVFDAFKKAPFIKKKVVAFNVEDQALCERLEHFVNDNVLKSHGVQLFDSNGGNVVLALFKAYYNNPLLLHAGTRKRIWNQYLENGWETVSLENLAIDDARNKWKAIKNPKTKEDEEKHIILVRAICDYISGMTDSYAMNEYNKIIHQ